MRIRTVSWTVYQRCVRCSLSIVEISVRALEMPGRRKELHLKALRDFGIEEKSHWFLFEIEDGLTEDEQSLVVLDPSHPLMIRYQQALRRHLTQREEKLNLQLREADNELKVLSNALLHDSPLRFSSLSVANPWKTWILGCHAVQSATGVSSAPDVVGKGTRSFRRDQSRSTTDWTRSEASERQAFEEERRSRRSNATE